MICTNDRNSTARFSAALIAAVFLISCVSPNIPPPMSFAKFVRDPGEGRKSGKVSFTTGAAIIGQDPESDNPDADFESVFYLFPVEGAMSMWLTKHYDLTFSVGSPFVMGLEGNVSFVATDTVRLGLIHGFGLAFMGNFTGYEGDWAGALYPDLSAGLFFQHTHPGIGSTFVGFKYTYGTYALLGGDPDYPDESSNTHYITWGIGHSFTTGRLRVTPEFIMCYGAWHWEYDDPEYGGEGDSDLFAFILSATFAAAY
ncbi:MAG: hypothetical protein ACYS5V_04130 [Planctomycetota bacterium]|jgi:hypothetical protein